MSGIPYNELHPVDLTVYDTNETVHVIEKVYWAFVVPCRDCRHCEHIEYTFKGHENEWWSCTRDWSGENTASVVESDGFCAWGERRDA